jgi:CBS domain-containing protein
MLMIARELMQADPVTVPADAPMLDVQHLLVTAQISGVPVVDGDGAVVGVISSSDVLRAFDEALDEDVDEGEAEDLEERLQSITAGEIATPEVVWVPPDMEVERVSELMRSQGIHRVLVGSAERLDGILTAFDLLRAV